MSNQIGADIFLLQKSLDAVWLRQRVISNNIANAETPGYKSKSVRFEELLADLVGKGSVDSEKFIAAVEKLEPRIIENRATSTGEDGNNVDLDKENIELARAQLQYEYLVTSLNSQLNRMKYAINGGN